jgi:hypothetical protein
LEKEKDMRRNRRSARKRKNSRRIIMAEGRGRKE